MSPVDFITRKTDREDSKKTWMRKKFSEIKRVKEAKADEKAKLREADALEKAAAKAAMAARKASLAEAEIEFQKSAIESKVSLHAGRKAQMENEERAALLGKIDSYSHKALKKIRLTAEKEAAISEANANKKAAMKKEEAAVFAAAKEAALLEKIKRKPLPKAHRNPAKRYFRKHCPIICDIVTVATRPFAHRPSWDKHCKHCIQKRDSDLSLEAEQNKPIETGVVDLLFGSQHAYLTRNEGRRRMSLD